MADWFAVYSLVYRACGESCNSFRRAGAITLFGATYAGIPVSTTHTITGAIVGVGSAKRFSAVKWGVAGRIVWAWVLTIPMAALIAAIAYFIIIGIAKMTGN